MTTHLYLLRMSSLHYVERADFRNTAGQEPISKFRNGAGYLPQKNVSVTTMTFHPHHMILAVGAEDGHLNVGLSALATV